MVNPMQLFQLKGMWDRFTKGHPRFPQFLRAAASRGLNEGTIIDVCLTQPDGEKIQTNLRLTAEDMQLFEEVKKFAAENKQS